MENIFVFCGEYADLPVSQCAAKARLSLLMALSGAANRIPISAKGLELAEAQSAMTVWSRDIDWEAWSFNFILMDVAALSAYASYRCTILLADDPFAAASQWARLMQVEQDELRIQLHRALMNASKIVVLGRGIERSLAPMLAHAPKYRNFPALPLRASNTRTQVLMVVHERQEQIAEAARNALAEAYPETNIAMFDNRRTFDRAWYAVIHIGQATSTEPGTRLRDAWAGAVPILQLVSPGHVRLFRANDISAESTVDHGKTGFLCSSVEGLVMAFGDLLTDPVAARVVARGAQRQIDSTKEWQAVASELLQ